MSDSYRNKVKERIRDEKFKQLWKIGTPNEEGFFIITEVSTKKVLTGDRTGLKIDGKFSKNKCESDVHTLGRPRIIVGP